MSEIYHRDTPESHERVEVSDSGDVVREERVAVDYGAERRNAAYTISQVIWLLFGILEGLIVIRIVLKLIAANPASPFANFIYGITAIFLWPFAGLTWNPNLGGMVLELSSIVGLIVFALLSWVLVKIVTLALFRPAEHARVVETHERDIR